MCKLLCWVICLIVTSPCLAADEIDRILQVTPKAELHVHLGGGFPLDYLLSIASQEQAEELLSMLEKMKRGVDYCECFGACDIVRKIVDTDEKVQAGAAALCRQLAQDGVTFAQISTSLKDLGNGHESYLHAVLRGLQEGKTPNFVPTLLLGLNRACNSKAAKRTVDLALAYRDQGICGIDLCENPSLGFLDAILPEIRRAKDAGLFVGLHMGELPGELNQTLILDQVNPDRICHGAFLDQSALEWVVRNRIPIEVCLSSSLSTRVIAKAEDHPALLLYQQGHPVVICTEDPLLFSTSLSREYRLFMEALGLSLEETLQVIADGFEIGVVEHEVREGFLGF
jgi:adenosine deaminase